MKAVVSIGACLLAGTAVAQMRVREAAAGADAKTGLPCGQAVSAA